MKTLILTFYIIKLSQFFNFLIFNYEILHENASLLKE